MTIFEKNVEIESQRFSCIFTIFHDRNPNKNSEQRANRDGSFYLAQNIIFLARTPKKILFSEGTQNRYFWCLVIKRENLGILVKKF